MRSVKEVLGPTFKGTIIEDPVLEPYFIQNSGGFTVSKKREDANGDIKYKDICYPSTFTSCLEHIAKAQLHEDGKMFSSIQEYIDAWKKVSRTILDAHKEWNSEKI